MAFHESLNASTTMQSQTQPSPSKSGKFGKYVLAGGSLVLVALIMRYALKAKPSQTWPEPEHPEYESHSCVGEMTDQERKEFMREMGKRGAEARWGKKPLKEATATK